MRMVLFQSVASLCVVFFGFTIFGRVSDAAAELEFTATAHNPWLNVISLFSQFSRIVNIRWAVGVMADATEVQWSVLVVYDILI